MPKQQSMGKCMLCGTTMDVRAMTRHLDACDRSAGTAKRPVSGKALPPAPAFLLFVSGAHEKSYWIYLAVSADAKLRALDLFLREIWLECCGHMSAFEVDGERFSLSAMSGERSMNARVAEAFGVVTKCSYEYDFGSTTELVLEVVDVRDLALPKSGVQLLARNEPPQITCDECGARPATLICTECAWDGGGWLCDPCARKHECGEEMSLPVVNSPRVGVCGYAG